jgi:hypothetical protein
MFGPTTKGERYMVNKLKGILVEEKGQGMITWFVWG